MKALSSIFSTFLTLLQYVITPKFPYADRKVKPGHRPDSGQFNPKPPIRFGLIFCVKNFSKS